MADGRMPWFEGATARGDEARRLPRRSGSRRNARDLRSVWRRSLERISARGSRAVRLVTRHFTWPVQLVRGLAALYELALAINVGFGSEQRP